jgi:hypothetical protein
MTTPAIAPEDKPVRADVVRLPELPADVVGCTPGVDTVPVGSEPDADELEPSSPPCFLLSLRTFVARYKWRMHVP